MEGMEARALETRMVFTPAQDYFQRQVEAHAEAVRRQLAAQESVLPEYLALQQRSAAEVEDVISAARQGSIDIIA
ncbi:MAG TPA: hypothetical protein VJC16_07025 [Candidatus Nanoarchaeia archaeon]|nr:hypothetical protein [Candidatus Nanoarchaeia archaeon]